MKLVDPPTPPFSTLSVVLMLCLACIATSSPSPSPTPTLPWPDNTLGTFASWSTDAPFHVHLSDIKASSTYARSIAIVTAHIDNVQSTARRMLENRQPTSASQPLHLCNHDGFGFSNAMKGSLRLRGYPEPPMTCLTEHDGAVVSSGVPPPASLELLMSAVRTFLSTVRDESEALVRTANATAYFTNPDVLFDFRHSTLTQSCTGNNVGAMRVNGVWYVQLRVTNQPVAVQLPFPRRRYLYEHHAATADGDALRPPLRFRYLPFLGAAAPPPDGGEPVKPAPDEQLVENTTTGIELKRGPAVAGVYNTVPIHKNPAILRALERGDFQSQQVDDALAPSSLALLILPLVLNLVPVALLAPVGTGAMLLYTMLSNVLTVVPLAVKGAELLRIGSMSTDALIVRVTNAINGSPSDTAAAELFTATCGGARPVGRIGLAFLVVALAFMVIGVTGEFVARRYMLKRIAWRQQQEATYEVRQLLDRLPAA